MPFILGIDTSCDDTSLAVLDQTGNVLASVVSSQTDIHSLYGGVVPELASRSHAQRLPALFARTLQEAGIALDDLTAIAVTQTPGLVSCLLVGTSFAKALAYRLHIPLYAVNHLEGHLFSPFLGSLPVFPFLGLVVSGGHTAFYRVESFCDLATIGQTVDDAAGEAFDKVAKMLGLGYPGGPAIDRLAQLGDPQAFPFTIAKVKMGEQYLSFSGLKTAAYQMHSQAGVPPQRLPDFCASLQHHIVESLICKLRYFFNRESFAAFALSGGVAMNSLLRKRCEEVCRQSGVPFYAAMPQYCADNAAMIAYAGLHQAKQADIFSLNAVASQKIQARQLRVRFEKS